MVPSLAAAHLLADRADGVVQVHAVAWLVSNLVLLFGAVAHYGYYRLSGAAAFGWLAAAVMVVAAYTVPFALVDAAAPSLLTVRAWSGDYVDLLPGLALLLLLVVARRREHTAPPVDPLLLGVLLGLGAGLLRLLHHQLTGGAAAAPPPWSPMVVHLAVVAIGIGAGVVAVRMGSLPRWVRTRFLVAVLCLVLAYGLHPAVDEFVGVRGGLLLGLNTLGSALLAVVGVQLLALGMLEQRRHVEILSRRAEAAEATLERDEEVFHEVRATMAGVNAATRILRGRTDHLEAPHRSHLEEMLEAEISRLEAMLASPGPAPVAAVSVDRVIGPLVASTRALGVRVDWTPTGTIAITGRVWLAEAVHILLTNAAHHAAGSSVHVAVVEQPDRLEIRVCDRGPGVPAGMEDAIFERGTRGVTSTGQGLGLHAARRLVHQLSGSLTVEPLPEGRGACFVLRLPQPPSPPATSPPATNPPSVHHLGSHHRTISSEV